eukprot:1200681-Amphidinium_carterae.1
MQVHFIRLADHWPQCNMRAAWYSKGRHRSVATTALVARYALKLEVVHICKQGWRNMYAAAFY